MNREDARTYIVEGMTCSHCEVAVAEEIAALDGVTAVDVDLPSGRLSVTGSDIDDAAVAAAVVEAGYTVRP